MLRGRGGLVALVLGIGLSCTVIISIVQELDRNFRTDDPVARADGQPLGGDFIAFYVGGRLYAEQRELLYDPEAQQDARRQVLGAIDEDLGGLPFVYPPLVAAVMSPVSALPFRQALLLWTGLGVSLSLSSLLVLVRSAGVSPAVPAPLAALLAVGFVPYSVNTFFGGQLSWLGVTLTALTMASLLHGRAFLAGLLFSLSYYKPPLFLLLLIVLVLSQGRRFLAGFSVGAAVLVALTLASVGVAGVQDFLATVSRYTYGQELTFGYELPPDVGAGLVAVAVTLSGSMPVSVGILVPVAVVLCVQSVLLLRSETPEGQVLGLLLALTSSLAFSIQLIHYDLALLLVVMLLALRWRQLAAVPTNALISLGLMAFYLEFLVRQVSLGGRVFNGSALLFLVVLAGLVWKSRSLLTVGSAHTTP